MNYKRTLRIDSKGDIATPNKKAEFLDGAQGAVQELKILLSTIRGEEPFAPEHGLRLFEAVGTSDAILKREIRTALQGDDRVESVDGVEIDRDSPEARVADITVTVTLVEQDQIQFSAGVG